MDTLDDAEDARLRDARNHKAPWKKRGPPYLSERQWGTVREDYSQTGNAWSYFSHDQARSRTCRWGEDGLAGISDDRQFLCFALAVGCRCPARDASGTGRQVVDQAVLLLPGEQVDPRRSAAP